MSSPLSQCVIEIQEGGADNLPIAELSLQDCKNILPTDFPHNLNKMC